ncbi:MAG: prepilin-type N-terminal cleavage/methylation domain-containing protein [Bacillaceae bacterium]|nr:prepilin-type N-terminal cleavage/methylation domain-containing protein [Bacillaceae bacterium]
MLKNEKGLTLVELLAAIMIAGIIIVPLLNIMTGTFTRTVTQQTETQIAYIAQDVMEKIRLNKDPFKVTTAVGDNSTKQLCWSNPETFCGTNTLPSAFDISTTEQVKVVVTVKPYQNLPFNEVVVEVMSDSFVYGGESGTVTKKTNGNRIELVTVVKK